MSAALLLAIGSLTGVGIYLITARSLSRIVLGFALLGHASVLALLGAGGPAGEPPLANSTSPANSSNPVPQALALTAIVIGFGLTLFLLALARRQQSYTGEDFVEDDLEDRRIADRAHDRQVAADALDDKNAAPSAPGPSAMPEESSP